MYKFKSVFDLESVFIEKLSEKYKLNERDLKKAFLKFDYDGNGLLDLDELGNAVRHFVQGVNASQVEELMQAYDQNGDGKISYEELLYNLSTRAATKSLREANRRESRDSKSSREPPTQYRIRKDIVQDNDDMDDVDMESEEYEAVIEPRGTKSSQGWNRRGSTGSDVSESVVDPTDTNALEAKAKIFFQSLRQNLTQRVSASVNRTRLNRYDSDETEYGTSLSGLGKSSGPKSHLLLPHSEYIEKEAKTILQKAFSEYVVESRGSRMGPKGTILTVEYSEFCKVLSKFKVVGSRGLSSSVMEYIFSLCMVEEDSHVSLNSSQNNRVFHRTEKPSYPVADVNAFLKLVFGGDENERSYVEQLNAGRKTVGVGPFPVSSGTVPVISVPSDGSTGKTLTKEVSSSVAATIASIPLRVISHKTKTSLSAPASFSSDWLKRSAQMPSCECIPAHVFGMSSSLQSGNTFLILPSTLPSPSISTSSNTRRSSPDYLDGVTVLYPTAALGVIHDLSTNTQRFYQGHSNDVTCYCLSSDGSLAATGCIASTNSPPLVHIWSTSGACDLLTVIGMKGKEGNTANPNSSFFSRSVNAVAFSYDSKYIVAVGCDDHHMMGIFDISTGQRVCEAPLQHGLPPQIKALHWCNTRQYTDYITRQHSGLCDVFVTAGDHHLRLWSFRRPSNSSETGYIAAGLDYKAPTLGKLKISPPKLYACCGFVPITTATASSSSTSADIAQDLIAGGSNGYVYLYRKGECVATSAAIKGGVKSIAIHGSYAFIGGASSSIKVLDIRTLATMLSVNVASSLVSSLRGTKSTIAKDNAVSIQRETKSTIRRSSSASTVSSTSRPRSSSASKYQRKSSIQSNDDDMNSLPSKDDISFQSQSSISISTPTSRRNSGSRMQQPNSNISPMTQIPDAHITGICIVPGIGRVALQSTYALITMSNGKFIRVNIGAALASIKAGTLSSPSSSVSSDASTMTLFYYHFSPIYGLAVDSGRHESSSEKQTRIIATCGDARMVYVWDVSNRSLVALTDSSEKYTNSAGRCCTFDKSNMFLAVGTSNGSIHIYSLEPSSSKEVSSLPLKLSPRGYRKDSREEVGDISFSPANHDGPSGREGRLAVGCHDNYIYIYATVLIPSTTTSEATCALSPLQKLSGHSSYVTHLDWSVDGRLIQSTCGANELLCWDLSTGKISGANVSDVRWKTQHCIFGFNLMGIWSNVASSNDINAVDLSEDRGIVVTADDEGFINVMNYPCIVKNAPRKRFPGHSSHVLSARFLSGGKGIASIGGNDASIILWNVSNPSELSSTFSTSRKGFGLKSSSLNQKSRKDFEEALF